MHSLPLRQDIIELILTGLSSEAPDSEAPNPTGGAVASAARLRPWRSDDLETLVAAWRDPEIARWNAVPPRSDAATAARWISGVSDRLVRQLSMDWVIELGPGESQRRLQGRTSSVVGEVGLSGFSDHHRGVFIGYWLLPSARGRGLASVAVAAVIEYAHQTLGLDPVVARCHPENPASGAVAARASCRLERADSNGHELWVSRRADAPV